MNDNVFAFGSFVIKLFSTLSMIMKWTFRLQTQPMFQIKVFANEIKYCYFGFGGPGERETKHLFGEMKTWKYFTSKRMITPCTKGDWKLYIALMKMCDVCLVSRRGKYGESEVTECKIFSFLTIRFRYRTS